MKKLILFAFTLLLSLSSFGQKNEIIYSYHSFNNEFIKGNTFSYYRNVSNRHAIGIKNSLFWNIEKTDFYREQYYINQMDLVHRINVVRSPGVRIMGEFGMSAKTIAQRFEVFYDDDVLIQENIDIPRNSSNRTNYFGFTIGMGFDFPIIKRIRLGAYMGTNKYLIMESQTREKDFESKWEPNYSLNLGFKF